MKENAMEEAVSLMTENQKLLLTQIRNIEKFMKDNPLGGELDSLMILGTFDLRGKGLFGVDHSWSIPNQGNAINTMIAMTLLRGDSKTKRAILQGVLKWSEVEKPEIANILEILLGSEIPDDPDCNCKACVDERAAKAEKIKTNLDIN